jgi:hypothetical protein
VALIVIRWIPVALLPSTMFLPTPMLRPTLMLQILFARLPTVFLTARTAPIPLGLLNGGLLNGGRLPDRWN